MDEHGNQLPEQREDDQAERAGGQASGPGPAPGPSVGGQGGALVLLASQRALSLVPGFGDDLLVR